MAKITNVEIGVLVWARVIALQSSFFAGKKLSFKMLIDAGTWKGSQGTP